MTTPNTQPLAALLAFHPEECAEVLAYIVSRGDEGAPALDVMLAVEEAESKDALMLAILRALLDGDLVSRSHYAPQPYIVSESDRTAIARAGALPWLRSRLPSAYRSPAVHARVRLHEVALAALYADQPRVASVVLCVPQPPNAVEFRDALRGAQRAGWSGDVEAEVVGVFGPTESEANHGR